MKVRVKFFNSFRLTMGSRESRYIPDKQPSAGTAFNDCRKGSHGSLSRCVALFYIQ